MWGILALVCILLGFVTDGFDHPWILHSSIAWFLAAIAFNTLAVVIPAFFQKKEAK